MKNQQICEKNRDTTTLIGFNNDNVKVVLDSLNIKTKRMKDEDYLLSHDGGIKSCEVCKRELTVKNVGNIAHGSNLVFCDNPICFISYLESKKAGR